jgi:hypothetical protein
VRGVAHKHDATQTPQRHAYLAGRIEVQVLVVHCGVEDFGNPPLVVAGERIGEDALLRRRPLRSLRTGPRFR